MEKLITSALAIAVCLGTTAMLANSGQRPSPTQIAEAQMATDGAYRDGLYLGKLTAKSGLRLLPPTGRWATERDRASFLAGYRRGFNGAASENQ